jgi:hypothetical protein
MIMIEERSNPIRTPAQRVLDATREVALAERGALESWRAPALVASYLGITEQYNGARTYTEASALRRFQGQVARSLNALARDGVLRKVGRGDRGPDGGWNRRNEACYYTPEEWDAAAARAAKHEAAAKAEEDRWAAIYDRLVALGIFPGGNRGEPVHLVVPEWSNLLDMAEGERDG